MNHLRFYVNDRLVEVGHLAPTTTLLYYLRYHLGLTGTKEGCNEGDCGACTVVVIDEAHPEGPRYRALNACLLLLPMLHNKRVYTVEALGAQGQPHLVQQAMVETYGSQCGYCTPGIVMSLFETCYRPDLSQAWQIDDQLAGNLCRCTGYRPIALAAQKVAGQQPQDRFAAALKEPAPPSESLDYQQGAQRFFTPATLGELFALLAAHSDARLVAGGTDLGLEVTKQHRALPCLVSLEGIAEAKVLRVVDGTLEIGAGARLADVESLCQDQWQPIGRMLRFFGARQIKNRATLGGNLCSASPIGDMAPVMSALGAEVVLASAQGRRTLPFDAFVLGYRKTALAPGEVLLQVRVPALAAEARAASYKVSKRQELDISIVSAAFYVEVDAAGVVRVARLAFGGVAARPAARASGVEEALVGKAWTEATIEAALPAMAEDFSPIDDHRGSAWYRRTVAANLVRGFYFESAENLVPRLSYRPTATLPSEVLS